MNGINVSTTMEHKLVKNPINHALKDTCTDFFYPFYILKSATDSCISTELSTSSCIVEVSQDSSPIKKRWKTLSCKLQIRFYNFYLDLKHIVHISIVDYFYNNKIITKHNTDSIKEGHTSLNLSLHQNEQNTCQYPRIPHTFVPIASTRKLDGFAHS